MEYSIHYPRPYEDHLYKKYCRCNNDVCICIITRVTNYDTKKQDILINGLRIDCIDLVEKPEFKPPEENIPYRPIKNREKFIPNKNERRVGRPKGSKNKNKKRQYNKCIIEKDKITPIIELIPVVPVVPEQIKEPPKKELTPYQKRLKRNKKYANKNKNKFKCIICNYNTHNISILKRHQNSKNHKNKMENVNQEVSVILNEILDNIKDEEVIINDNITFEKVNNDLNTTLDFIKNLFKN